MALPRRMARALSRGVRGRLGRPSSPEQRGIDLLVANLTPSQRRQYARDGCFDVIGGDSGKRYRIWHCFQQNIQELDAPGPRKRIWCFHPRQNLVLGDVMLAQKTALELFEVEALSIAHVYWDFAANGGPMSRRAREDFNRTLRLPLRQRIARALGSLRRTLREQTEELADISAGALVRAGRLCVLVIAFSCLPAFVLF